MKISTLIACVAGIVIPLQVTTVYYVVSVEHRLTALESQAAMHRTAAPEAALVEARER